MARSLFTIALYAATRADAPDLRAHIVADVAAQHNFFGHPDEAIRLVRLGETDERIAPGVQMVLAGVRARAYGMKGDTEACVRQLRLAEQAQTKAAGGEAAGWLATIATGAQLAAASGHALASLAGLTGSAAAREEAQHYLAQAVAGLGPDRRRAAALCQARLATVYLEAGELEPGTRWARSAIDAATASGRRGWWITWPGCGPPPRATPTSQRCGSWSRTSTPLPRRP